MNGGGPSAVPLRALRHPPVLVDDAGVLPRLAAAAHDVAGEQLPLEAPELVRWTRAWMVACQGLLHDRGIVGTVPPWTVPLVAAELPTLKGDPDRVRFRAALSLLGAAAIAAPSDDGRIITFGQLAFTEHRAGLELDWGAVCRAVGYEPAPLLVARALADLIVPAAEPTPATLSELADRTGYATKQVRTALRRLADAGMLRMSESAGLATQYCFDSGALPTAPIVPPPAPSLARAEATPAAPVSPPPAEAARRTVALRVTLNGVTLSLGPGLAPHVELGPDGVPHVSFDPPADGA